MAINKKLIHFKTKSVFNQKLANNEILDTSIVFIQDTREIWTHGQFYDCSGGTTTDTSQWITEEELQELLSPIQSSLVNKLEEKDLEGYAKSEDVPTKLSDLTDDSDFITNTEATAAYAPKSLVETVDNQATTISTLATKTELSTGLAGKLDNSAASGFVPTTRKINGVALDKDITISATDPNAATKTELNSVNTDLQTFKSNVAITYATDQDVANAVSALVDSSPDTLNTLNELAAALGDDPNFATTVATQIGTKADQSALNTTNTNLANLTFTVNGKVDKEAGKGLSTYDFNDSWTMDIEKASNDPLWISWEDLLSLRDNNELIEGRLYRITDYVTTTTQENTQSAGHRFDIIVLALDNHTLAEEAWAIYSEEDPYFADRGANLSAWKIWYCLDNDTNRFLWADTTNGKGVIYRMIDEFNNDCPYDFKNIQFKHPNDTVTYPDYYYTFSTVIDNVVTDHSLLQGYCHGNIITIILYNTYEYSVEQELNNNIFLNTSKTSKCNYNSFGNSCYKNSFGNSCSYNSFGNSCYKNSFGNSCSYNSFGNSCYKNSFGNECTHNSFVNHCRSNSFGNDCNSNSFGNDCYDNSFENNCSANSFGNESSGNSFKNNCDSNSFGNESGGNYFGNNCRANSFGNNCDYNSFRVSASTTSTLKDYVHYNHFDDGCSFNVIWCSSTTGTGRLLQNINVNRSVCGTSSSYNMINIDTVDADYEIEITKTGDGIYTYTITEADDNEVNSVWNKIINE